MTDRPRRFGLSKSKITMFEQCPKRLWLSVHRRALAEQDEGAEARFATGHEVGAIACALLPDGVRPLGDWVATPRMIRASSTVCGSTHSISISGK